MNNFVPEDIVMLKSGGPRMTVANVSIAIFTATV